MYEKPTPLERLLGAVDGAWWVRVDKRTNRLFVWHPAAPRVRVYSVDGVEAETWPMPVDKPLNQDSADLTVTERLNAGY